MMEKLPVTSSFFTTSYNRNLQQHHSFFANHDPAIMIPAAPSLTKKSGKLNQKVLKESSISDSLHRDERDIISTNKNVDMNIAICGAGIGGMALALSLHDAGFRNVEIYEAAPKIREIGVGINIQPSAIRELTELGLGKELAMTGIPTAEILYYHINGQKIYQEPRGQAAGYSWPQYSIHRGKFLGILHRAVVARLGSESIHTGHKVIDCGNCDRGSSSSWATFEIIKNGGGKEENDSSVKKIKKTIQADLIVACDGVHSKIRKVLTKEGVPRFTGITMLRGLTRMKPFLSGCSMTIIGPIEREMVIYPISKEAEEEGESLVNWVALKKIDEG